MSLPLPEVAYRHLRKKLLEGELQPGMRLDYRKIGKELGVSTTPVREAVGMLASDGFVELVPRLGAVVRSPTIDDVKELYGIREAIEPYAAQRAAGHAHPESIAALDKLVEEMKVVAERHDEAEMIEGDELRAFLQLDLSFHLTLLEAAGNRRLIKLVADSHILSTVFKAKHAHPDRTLRGACEQHDAILTAIKEGREEDARKLMADHVAYARDGAISAYRASGSEAWIAAV